MKKMTKIVTIMISISVLSLCVIGCGGNKSGKVDKKIKSVSEVNDGGPSVKNVSSNTTKESDDNMSQIEDVSIVSDDSTDTTYDSGEAKVDIDTHEDSSSSSEISIDEQVIYNDKGIKITATGLEDGWLGTELKLLIENDSSKGITVQARGANVNGYMVDTMLSSDVAAGKKVNDELTFTTSGLKECGISQIANMEFSLHIFDSETWDGIVDTDMISINTSIADSYVQEVDDAGEVLVNSDGIKIVAKGLSSDDSFWGPGIILYIENNTSENITVQVRDVSINGFMVEPTMSEDIVAGKKAMSAVQFFRSDLEKNNITNISDIELYFHIFDEKTWDTILDTNVINLKF